MEQTVARRRGQRAELTRERIVIAADALARRDGFDRVTIRGLCDELAVTPASVYWYVDGKDELLREVLDRVLARVPRPAHGSGHWLARLVTFYGSVREIFGAYPGIGSAMLAQPFGTEASLSHCAYVLELLSEGRFDDETAASLYIALSTYTAGHLMLVDGARGPDVAARPRAEEIVGEVRSVLARRPELRAFNDVLQGYDAARVHAEYLSTVERMVRGAAATTGVRIRTSR